MIRSQNESGWGSSRLRQVDGRFQAANEIEHDSCLFVSATVLRLIVFRRRAEALMAEAPDVRCDG